MRHNAPEAGLASLLASRGRNGDSVLVHMTPGEVEGLQALALAQGGSLTINPETGLPEANILKKLLPTIAGGVLNAIFPGMGAIGTGLAVAGVTGLAEGSFSKGLKAGMGAYSGASISEGLRAAAMANRPEMQAYRKSLADTSDELSELTGLRGESKNVLSGGIQSVMPAPKPVTPMPAIGKGSYVTQGIKGLLGKDPSSRQAFMEAIGGPKAAGFVVSPIMQAFDEYEMERAERAQRRRQPPEYYYSPGKFDFQSGTFAPGAYYTKEGKPYTPPNPWGFADGGLAMIDPRSNPGGDPNIMVAAPGTVTPPTQAFSFTQDPTERRQIVDQYIADLNARLARGLPKYEAAPAPPPASGGGAGIGDIGGAGIADVTRLIGGIGGIDGYQDIITKRPLYTEPTPDIQDLFYVQPTPPFYSTSTTPVVVPSKEKEDQVSIEVESPDVIGSDYSGLPISIGGGGGGGASAGQAIPSNTGSVTIPLEDLLPGEAITGPNDPRLITPGAIDTPIEVPSELDPSTQQALYDAQQEQDAEDILNWLDSQGYGYIPSQGLQIPEPEIQQAVPVEYPETLDPTTIKALEEAAKNGDSWAAKALAALKASGGVTGALLGAGEALLGGGGFSDVLGGAVSGYFPDYMENPFNELFNRYENEGVIQILPDYGLEDIEATAKKWGYAHGGSVQQYAAGGIGSLPQYRAGGKYLNGPGDGMSDDIKANIEGRQEARLADGEFVIPADVVSHLGNGSSNAGAKKLHAMMDRIRQARTGKKRQAPAVKADRYLPA